LAAVVGIGELERLESAVRTIRHLARTFGQSPSLLEQIEKGKVHPAMSAFGLWKDEVDVADLDKEVLENRRAGSQPNIDY
jgi:predicted transcriptional regulator